LFPAHDRIKESKGGRKMKIYEVGQEFYLTRTLAKFVAGDAPITEINVIEHVDGYSSPSLNRRTKPVTGEDTEAKRKFLLGIQGEDS
jgi:hypothetical protein